MATDAVSFGELKLYRVLYPSIFSVTGTISGRGILSH
jgi:hypothetical protein